MCTIQKLKASSFWRAVFAKEVLGRECEKVTIISIATGNPSGCVCGRNKRVDRDLIVCSGILFSFGAVAVQGL
jgi:hypothetical protein